MHVRLSRHAHTEDGSGVCRTKEAAERALVEMNGAEVGQWKVRCGWAHHKAEAAPQPLDAAAIDASDPTNNNVYIGNLSSEVHSSIHRPMSMLGGVAR